MTVKTAVVVFLTDGQDNKYHGSKALELVPEFKKHVSEWTKNLIVHTVGFSRSHDFRFLDALRKAGSKDGVFRYADPSDSGDALCTKLSDLATSIFSSSSLNLRVRAPFPLLGGTPAIKTKEEEENYFEKDIILSIEEDHGRAHLYVDLSGEGQHG